MQYVDTNSTSSRAWIHSFEAFSSFKIQYLNAIALGGVGARTVIVPLIDRKYTVRVLAGATGTSSFNLYLLGYGVAAP